MAVLGAWAAWAGAVIYETVFSSLLARPEYFEPLVLWGEGPVAHPGGFAQINCEVGKAGWFLAGGVPNPGPSLLLMQPNLCEVQGAVATATKSSARTRAGKAMTYMSSWKAEMAFHPEAGASKCWNAAPVHHVVFESQMPAFISHDQTLQT